MSVSVTVYCPPGRLQFVDAVVFLVCSLLNVQSFQFATVSCSPILD